MESLVMEAIKASTDTTACRETMDTLRSKGFGDEAFRRLHPQHDSAAGFYSYCQGVQRFLEDGNNHRVHQRLAYLLASYRDGALLKGKSFQALAEEAFRLIPPIA